VSPSAVSVGAALEGLFMAGRDLNVIAVVLSNEIVLPSGDARVVDVVCVVLDNVAIIM
jgi:hypothetical protein